MKKELYSEPIFDQKVSLIVKREKLKEEIRKEQENLAKLWREKDLNESFWKGVMLGISITGITVAIMIGIYL